MFAMVVSVVILDMQSSVACAGHNNALPCTVLDSDIQTLQRCTRVAWLSSRCSMTSRSTERRTTLPRRSFYAVAMVRCVTDLHCALKIVSYQVISFQVNFAHFPGQSEQHLDLYDKKASARWCELDSYPCHHR